MCVTEREREKGRQCALGRLQYQPTPDGGRKINSGREREREREREQGDRHHDKKPKREVLYVCICLCGGLSVSDTVRESRVN